MSTMKVLYVTGASGGISGVRAIDYQVQSVMHTVSDETLGTKEYRGQPKIVGVLFVEDVWTATALQVANQANVTVGVVAAEGAGTITIIGFKSFGYKAATLRDGTKGGPIPGYAVSFIGILDDSVSAAYAATHALS